MKRKPDDKTLIRSTSWTSNFLQSQAFWTWEAFATIVSQDQVYIQMNFNKEDKQKELSSAM